MIHQSNSFPSMNLQLHRTDSTTLSYISYKKSVGSILSPMGRIRRINRLDTELIKEFNKYFADRDHESQRMPMPAECDGSWGHGSMNSS